ncbi:MAG: sulfatase-like hydrolase/transferase [Gemmatimonadota bacterium]|nr:sulfatase-like hydrolase/transferase [Gemmatimonadota bacterium]
MSKPNIVFLYSDQHRGDAVGCAGHPVIKTPYLDRLGAEGVVFSQCYTNGPICMPARDDDDGAVCARTKKQLVINYYQKARKTHSL